MRRKIGVVVILLGILLSGCQFNFGGNAVARANLSRDKAPQVPAADAQALLAGNTAFAFDFYQQVRGGKGNLVFSPFSITLAAAMLYGGAAGDTASQMADTLHFTLPSAQLHPALNALSLDISKREAQSKKFLAPTPLRLYIANAVWGQRDYPFEQAYLDLLAVNYGTGMRLLDFASDPDAARQKINAWVERETQGKIRDVLPPDSIGQDTRLVLADAIYFKAAWQDAFNKDLTREAPFTLLDGTQVRVPTMQTDEGVPLRFGSGDGYQAVALPYKGKLVEMVIILPDQDRYAAFESGLDAGKFSAILDELHPGSLKLYMPKFEFSTDLDLKDVLSALGMPLAFNRYQADFSGITLAQPAYVQQARHKAYILTDEEGTQASAATIFDVAPTSLRLGLHIDRPFIFVIRDVPSGTILFVGRVLNPLDK